MAPEQERRRGWRSGLVTLAVACTVAAALLAGWLRFRFPPDTTPDGAYLRVAASVSHDEPRVVFSYLEDDAQHAAYTIRDYRKRASERAAASFPEPERTRLMSEWRAYAEAPDGADVWHVIAAERGWIARLRGDLSAIAKVEVAGDRATVVTARGTRYGMRRRSNGMWGLTMFTADLLAESERAARDWDVVDRAARDYDRGR